MAAAAAAAADVGCCNQRRCCIAVGGADADGDASKGGAAAGESAEALPKCPPFEFESTLVRSTEEAAAASVRWSRQGSSIMGERASAPPTFVSPLERDLLDLLPACLSACRGKCFQAH